MARGSTRGERRRRRRRGVAQPAADAPVPVGEHEPVDDLAQRMDEQPGWVRRLWATPGNRLTLSAAVVAFAVWVLLHGLTDPGAFDGRRFGALFALAPIMLALFGPQAIEAIADLRHGRNSWPPIFHRMGARLDRRAGLVVGLLIAYIVVGAYAAGALLGR